MKTAALYEDCSDRNIYHKCIYMHEIRNANLDYMCMSHAQIMNTVLSFSICSEHMKLHQNLQRLGACQVRFAVTLSLFVYSEYKEGVLRKEALHL